jgi:hypothetical protein
MMSFEMIGAFLALAVVGFVIGYMASGFKNRKKQFFLNILQNAGKVYYQNAEIKGVPVRISLSFGERDTKAIFANFQSVDEIVNTYMDACHQYMEKLLTDWQVPVEDIAKGPPLEGEIKLVDNTRAHLNEMANPKGINILVVGFSSIEEDD